MRMPAVELVLTTATVAALFAVATYADTASRAGAREGQSESVVDARGNIRVPPGYGSTYQFLGSWAIAAAAPGRGSKEVHVVYALPGVVEAYRSDGHFPEGAVLVKEVYATTTATMTTGTVSRPGALKGWFVMVRDTSSRYSGNPLWGEGWGWSWFDATNPAKTTSTDYRKDCLACHVPAKDSEWVYVAGYPILGRR
jgi:hypothetical protein